MISQVVRERKVRVERDEKADLPVGVGLVGTQNNFI